LLLKAKAVGFLLQLEWQHTPSTKASSILGKVLTPYWSVGIDEIRKGTIHSGLQLSRRPSAISAINDANFTAKNERH
jgi:hypothetical protein